MNTLSRFRWVVLLLALPLSISAGYRLVVYTQANICIEDETGRLARLEEGLEWSRRRLEGKAAALNEYAEGRATLEATARRFRDFDGEDKWEMSRLRRLWPSAASDEERHAADVLDCLARRAGKEKGHEVVSRAADDYRRTYGEPPVPVKS